VIVAAAAPLAAATPAPPAKPVAKPVAARGPRWWIRPLVLMTRNPAVAEGPRDAGVPVEIL